RDHDGGLCTGSRAPARCNAGGGDQGGMPGAFPADHDDDLGRAVRRAAAGIGLRDRCGTAPATGDLDCRRADRVADADLVHDAGSLSRTGTACGTQAGDRVAGARGVGAGLLSCYALTRGQPPSLSGRQASAGEIFASSLQKSYLYFDSDAALTCQRYISCITRPSSRILMSVL